VAHHKDALKRIRQTEKRTDRNKGLRTFYRNQIKDVKTAVAAGNKPEAETALPKAIRAIDRAVTKNVLQRNTASRYKSRLTRAVAAIGSAKAAQA
jgi:small subunit ribosomal protein S20